MKKIEDVIVHPIVLLSIVDHYNRVARDSNRRVVGVLLGRYKQVNIGKENLMLQMFMPFPLMRIPVIRTLGI